MKLQDWRKDTWDIEGEDSTFNFKIIPRSGGKAKSTIEKTFFELFMKIFGAQDKPSLTTLPLWLFIYRDDKDYAAVEHFAKNDSFFRG